ncbi:MAG: hypothetical protein K2L55_01375 [Muribaculaceae bacterium]|nr:hypothetical protein [Muribaculaceae bacterium]
MINCDTADDVVEDAVGIFIRLTRSWRESALAGSMCGQETLPQASSIYIGYPYINGSRCEEE